MLYAKGEQYALFLGDCTDILPRLPAESADMIFAEPPPDHQVTRCANYKRRAGIPGILAWHRQWLAACHRILKPHGTIWVTGSCPEIYTLGFALQSAGFSIISDISWIHPATVAARQDFAPSHRTLIWAAKTPGALSRNHPLFFQMDGGRQIKNVWHIAHHPGEKGNGEVAEKPLELLERVILSSSRVGDVVLDPFARTGVTGVAALNLDRRYIGLDTSRAALEEHNRRLLNVLHHATGYQPPLHAYAV